MGRRKDMPEGRPEASRAARAGARAAGLALAVAVAACGHLGPLAPDADPGALELRFEDQPAPEVFLIEAGAVRDAPDGAPGLWASVRGLARPERAEVVNLASGKSVDVALYRAGGSGPTIRLSDEAADALGIADEPVNVRITALRRRPVVDTR